MAKDIEIRELQTMDELALMQEVEEAVWQVPPIPVHQTYTSVLNGGIVLGAFLDGKIIGFQYSFAGFDGNMPYLCSHMLGILPEYRKGGLGLQLKNKQAEVARRLGYDMMTWTFDPLESVNAYLNLHKLRATGAFYLVDHYGMMDDGLNNGMPTDRIKVQWWINEDQKVVDIPLEQAKILVDLDESGEPETTDVFANHYSKDSDAWFVAIPENIQKLKVDNIELAIKWRYETRKAFVQLFKDGYKATDLVRSTNVNYYCFTK